MPNTRSAKKHLRQNSRRRLRNKNFASLAKTQVKKFEAALAVGNLEAAQHEFRETARQLDQVADKGIIHKKTASRKKARLHKRLMGLLPAQAPAASQEPLPKAE